MKPAPEIEICPLTGDLLPDVVRIHRDALGYTLNSRLGDAHLMRLYSQMSKDSESYVGVAVVEGRPAGVVSGTLNEDRLKARLLGSLPPSALLTVLAELVRHPGLIGAWLQSLSIARPVYHEGKRVEAVLTALAVDARFRGRGLAKELIAALERYFSARQVGIYRLDTLITNQPAQSLYAGLGFIEVARRAGSAILVRMIKA